MMRRKTITFSLLLMIGICTHNMTAHVFDTIARGIYHTAKCGFLTAPVLAVPISAGWAYYVTKANPNLVKATQQAPADLSGFQANLVQTYYPDCPEMTQLVTKLVRYIQQEASRLLKAELRQVRLDRYWARLGSS